VFWEAGFATWTLSFSRFCWWAFAWASFGLALSSVLLFFFSRFVCLVRVMVVVVEFDVLKPGDFEDGIDEAGVQPSSQPWTGMFSLFDLEVWKIYIF
jgi:hypothetical protein